MERELQLGSDYVPSTSSRYEDCDSSRAASLEKGRRYLASGPVSGLTAALLLRDTRDGPWALLGKALVRGHYWRDIAAQLGISAAITTGLLKFVPKVLRFVPKMRFVPNANYISTSAYINYSILRTTLRCLSRFVVATVFHYSSLLLSSRSLPRAEILLSL
jgi:hypothetical protein